MLGLKQPNFIVVDSDRIRAAYTVSVLSQMGQAHCVYSQADLDQVQKEVGPITAAFIAAEFGADFVRHLKDRHDFVIYVTSSGNVDSRVYQEAGAKEVIPISRVQELIAKHFGTDTTLAERENEPEPRPKREGIFRRFFRWGKKKPEDHLADVKKGDREHLSSPSELDVVRSGVLVHASSEVTQALRRAGFSVVSDPAKAAVCVVQADKAAYVPAGLPVVVLSAGNLSDIIATSRIPGAVLARPEELVDVVRSVLKDEGVLEDEETEPETPQVVHDEEEQPPPQPQEAQLHVLPGGFSERFATLPYHGVLYIVSPSNAALAGELAARLALTTPGSALVCASGASTAALALGMAPEELVARDWRIPGAEAPVEFRGVTVWPVDPAKFLDVQDALPGALVSQVRDRFSLTIVDTAADLALAASAARNAVVAVIKRGGVVEEWLVNRWLADHGARALVLKPGETLRLKQMGGGVVLEIVKAESARPDALLDS